MNYDDLYMVPELERLEREGVLAPFSDDAEVCMSGRRYPNAGDRGLATWSPHDPRRLLLLKNIQLILVEYEAYLPLTLRQIYYRLIGGFGEAKSDTLYNTVLKIGNRGRRGGRISFDAIRDDGLTHRVAPGWDSKEDFLDFCRRQAEHFELKGSLNQPYWVELWCEAAGMVPQLTKVAHDYGVPVCSCGGFDSLSVKHDFVREVLDREQPTMVLQVGDLDPSGVSILDSLASDVTKFCSDYAPDREDAIDFRRVLVRPEQEAKYGLVREDISPEKRKIGDGVCKRTDRPFNPPFNYTIQAEAFAPDVLATVVREAIESVIDLDELERTREESADIRDELEEWLDEKGE